MPSTTTVPAREDECPDMARLRYAYQIAAADYSRAVMVLSERSGMMSKTDYIQVRDYSEKARGLAEAARDALDRHTAEHGCR